MTVKRYLYRKWLMLYSKIVREKASPEYIARGWAIGMFFGCFIPFGLQLVCSIPTAFLLKGSKIGATLGTLITNHFTIFIIYPAQCWVGSHLLGGTLSYHAIETAMADVLKEQSYEALMKIGGELVAAFFLGGALLSVIMTPLTYWFVKNLVIRYRNRKAAHAAARVTVPSEKLAGFSGCAVRRIRRGRFPARCRDEAHRSGPER